MPAAPCVEGFAQLFGIAVAAGQPEGHAEFAQFCDVDPSRSPYTGSPAALSWSLPRGGALWPPAVGPSMTRPSTRPLARRSMVVARVLEETMARKRGPGQTRAGPLGVVGGIEVHHGVFALARTAPVTESLYSAGCVRPAKASSTPGMWSGMPAPIST